MRRVDGSDDYARYESVRTRGLQGSGSVFGEAAVEGFLHQNSASMCRCGCLRGFDVLGVAERNHQDVYVRRQCAEARERLGGCAHRPDVACLLARVQGLQCACIDQARLVPTIGMQQNAVEAVRAERSQRALDAQEGGVPREIEGRASAVIGLARLRDEHELIASSLEQVAEAGFRIAVGGRRIEQGDPVDNGRRSGRLHRCRWGDVPASDSAILCFAR